VSNGYSLELLRWGDGEVHLVYWDCLEGKDLNFVIKRAMNTVTQKYEVLVYKSKYANPEDETPTLILIDDLPWELLMLCNQLERRDSTIED